MIFKMASSGDFQTRNFGAPGILVPVWVVPTWQIPQNRVEIGNAVQEGVRKSWKVAQSCAKSCKVMESRKKSRKVVENHRMWLKIKENSPWKGVHGARLFCGISPAPVVHMISGFMGGGF